MSFFTSLVLYRPGPAPAVTADGLGRLCDDLIDAGLLAADVRGREPCGGLSVKFGPAADMDDLGTSIEEPDGTGRFVHVRPIAWDVDLPGRPPVREVAAALREDQRTIYRAWVDLGAAADGLTDPLTREPGPDNERGFYPQDLSLSVGPVTCGMLDEDATRVGWTAASLSGSGYLFPWTRAETLAKIAAVPALRELEEACQRRFPAPSANGAEEFGWRWDVAES